jgi:hypothetical protein
VLRSAKRPIKTRDSGKDNLERPALRLYRSLLDLRQVEVAWVGSLPVWVQRDEQEIAKWHETRRRQARSHALTMACIVGVLFVVLGAGGWVYFSRAGVAFRRNVIGTLGTRLIVFSIAAVPFALWVYRSEYRKELGKALRRTICPTCDIGGENTPGTACRCGELFVPQSEMKWVERK